MQSPRALMYSRCENLSLNTHGYMPSLCTENMLGEGADTVGLAYGPIWLLSRHHVDTNVICKITRWLDTRSWNDRERSTYMGSKIEL